MAIQLGSAYGKVSIDATGVKTGVDQAKSALNGLSAAVSALTGIIGGLALYRLGEGALSVAKDSILAAARVEELATINDVLAKNAGLSEEAVRKEAQAIKDMGIEAGISQEVVAEFVRNGLDLSKASELARVAQDAATISGENSTEALYGLIDGIVTLQPLVLRNHGIIVDLANAYDKYGGSLGSTAVDEQAVADATEKLNIAQMELADVQGKGGVDADKVAAAQKRVTSATQALDDAETNLQRTERDLEALRASKSHTALQIAHAEERVADAQTRVERVTNDVSDAEANLSKTQTTTGPSATSLAKAQQKVADAEQKLKDIQSGSGGTIANLTTEQKQQAALNAVLEAGTHVAGAYEAAMTSGSKVLRSYPRYLNDIEVNLGKPFLGSFDNAILAIGKFLSGLGKATDEGGTLKPVLDKVAGSVKVLADHFVIFLNNVDLLKLANNISVILDGLIKFSTYLLDHGPQIVQILTWIGGALAAAFAISTVNNIATAMAAMANPIGLFVILIGLIIMAAQNLTPAQQKIVYALTGIVTAIVALAYAAPKLAIVGGFFAKLIGILAAPGTAVTISGIGTAITGSLIPGLVSLATTIWTVALPALGAFLVGTAEIWVPIVFIIAALALLYFAFKNNFGGIRTTAEQLWFILKYRFAEGWANLITSTQVGLATMAKNISDWDEANHLSLGGFIGWLMMAWANAMNFLAQASAGGRNAIISAFRVDWGSLGKSIIQGIINGFVSGLAALLAAAQNAAKSVLAVFDKVLNAHSASQEMFKRGVWSGQGYTLGLAASMDPTKIAKLVARPMQQMSQNSQQQFVINMASGLTLQQAYGMVQTSEDRIMENVYRLLGG